MRKECKISLAVSSYQVIAMAFLLEGTLGKIVRLAEFLFGNPTAPLN